MSTTATETGGAMPPTTTAPENTTTTPPPVTDPPVAEVGPTGQAAIDAERKARRDAEKALKQAQAQLAAIADKDKSDLQKATEAGAAAEARAVAAEQALAAAAVRDEVSKAAATAGAISVDAVVAMAAGRVTVGDDGLPANVPAVVAAIRTSNPELFRTVAPGTRDAHAGGGQQLALNGDPLLASVLAAVGGPRQ